MKNRSQTANNPMHRNESAKILSSTLGDQMPQAAETTQSYGECAAEGGAYRTREGVKRLT